MNSRLNRRRLLAAAATVPVLAASGSLSRNVFAQATPGASPTGSDLPPLDKLRIRHPNTLAFAAPFLLVDTDGVLSTYANEVDVAEWSSPETLRPMLVNGESEVTAVPTYVGANLYNRGIDVRMAAVVVWGLLWVLGPEGTAPDWESLRGQTIMVPYPNDMPDLVFRYLATSNGLTPGEDFQVEYYAQTPEVVARLVAGKGNWAVLSEHAATLAISQAQQNDISLGRVLSLQEEWGAATGTEPRIPQAGIVVPGWLADERPALLGAVLDELEQAVATVNAAQPETVAILSEGTGVPEPVVQDVIPRLNLDVVPGADAREELERFYTELSTLSPDIIGGKLPDASFYLEDPR